MNDEIPCEKDPALTQKIEEFSEILKSQAHKLDPFGMSEKDFYDSGIFEGSVQRVRGQISAAMQAASVEDEMIFRASDGLIF